MVEELENGITRMGSKGIQHTNEPRWCWSLEPGRIWSRWTREGYYRRECFVLNEDRHMMMEKYTKWIRRRCNVVFRREVFQPGRFQCHSRLPEWCRSLHVWHICPASWVALDKVEGLTRSSRQQWVSIRYCHAAMPNWWVTKKVMNSTQATALLWIPLCLSRSTSNERRLGLTVTFYCNLIVSLSWGNACMEEIYTGCH